jgi:predicted dehydrogenase
MQQGKPVFIQKPLAHDIWQARTLQKAMHRYKVQTVMGNQGHCGENIRCIVEWTRLGILGDVTEVHCWTDRPCAPWFIKPKRFPPEPVPVPDGLNWDLWQGPVPARAYSPDYLPQRWRGWWAYGCGGLGDIGCHVLDAPFWALELGAPSRVEVVELRDRVDGAYTPFGAHLVYHFPARGTKPPVRLHWWEGALHPEPLPGMDKLPSNGMIMKGSRETLFAEDMRPVDPTLWPRERMKEYAKAMEEETLPRCQARGPVGELFLAIRGDGPAPGSNFDYAAPLTEVVLLGTMAIRAGRDMEWDAEAMRVTNVPEANAWVKQPVREGWSWGEELWRA